MPWFYNSYSGELTHASGWKAWPYEAAIHTATGWHELPVPDSATEAQAAAAAAKLGGTTPTTSLAKGLENVPGGVASAAASKVLGGGFHLIFGNTGGLLGRILKMGIGVILLVAGVLKLSNTDKKLEAVLPLVGGPAGKVLRA